MPGITFGTVVDPSNNITPDNNSGNFNMGHANEMLVAELHGKYFTQNYRGNLFIGSTSTSGAVIPIATTKTPVYTIWNPAGSGKLCVPVSTLISWNATTGVLGGLVWIATTNAGATTAAAGFTAFSTPATPISANLNSNVGAAAKNSKMNFGNDGTTITLSAAGTMYRSTGITVSAMTAATISQPWAAWRDDWDGNCIVPPGNAIHLMGSTAVALTAFVSTVWAEIPL